MSAAATTADLAWPRALRCCRSIDRGVLWALAVSRAGVLRHEIAEPVGLSLCRWVGLQPEAAAIPSPCTEPLRLRSPARPGPSRLSRVDVNSGVLSGLARKLKIDPDWLIGAGGASGSAWMVREMNTVLRVGSRLQIDVEAEAHRLAAQFVPVPRVLDRADFEGSAGLLLEWMPGQTAFEAARRDAAAALRIGTACGALHDRIDLIPTPPFEHSVGPGGLGPQGLLHLDLHPKNVLVDEHGEVTAVLDWANAARGSPWAR